MRPVGIDAPRGSRVDFTEIRREYGWEAREKKAFQPKVRAWTTSVMNNSSLANADTICFARYRPRRWRRSCRKSS